MPYRFVLDETVEPEVGHRLENDGHDVIHVDSIPELGTGTDDERLAAYSIETDRVIVTDDDFVVELPADDDRAVLYLSDATLEAEQVADIVHAVSLASPQRELRGLAFVGRTWL